MYDSVIQQLIAVTTKFAVKEGETPTCIPYFTINRDSRETSLVPSIVQPSLCLVLQGSKNLQLGSNMYHYYPCDFLVSMFDIPASVQLVEVSRERPYLGLKVDFTTEEVAEVMMDAQVQRNLKQGELLPGAFIGEADSHLLGLFLRLLALLDQPPEDIRYLSLLTKREMLFRLLTGAYGNWFIQQMNLIHRGDGVSKAITWIKKNYKVAFSVEELAKLSGLSISRFHHNFKRVTTMGPLQYQKQLRLQEARRLLLSKSMDATTVALEVGYDSPSQFSREYRRLFGLPPLKDTKVMQS